MEKGKIMLLGLAILAAASVGTTWAAWSQVIRTGSEYRVPRYKTGLEGYFRQSGDWQPGITAQEQVWVSSNLKVENGSLESGVPVITRMEIHQNWIRRENVYVLDQNGSEATVPPFEGEALPSDFVTDQGERQYVAILAFNKEAVMVLRSGMARDADIRLNLSYADKVEDAREKWLLMNEEPSETGSCILYYIGVTQSREDSPVFSKSATVSPLLKGAITGKNTYYEKTEDGYKQITVTRTNAKYRYGDSRYTMDIKAAMMQATRMTVEHTFTGGFNQEVIRYLIDQVADPGIYDASGLEKELTLICNRGSQGPEYVPYRPGTEEKKGNRFMNFTDMVPGGIYKDRLKVENTTSNQTVRVYIRIDPREQGQIRDELLKKITMKVIFRDSVLYEGKVTDTRYGEGENLQELIPLCYLKSSTSEEIQAELWLDPSTICGPVTGVCAYADWSAKIGWEFMIQTFSDNGGGDGGGSGDGGGQRNVVTIDDTEVPQAVMIPDPRIPLAALPKIGDITPLLVLGAMTAISFLLLLALGVLWFRTHRKEDQV